MCRNKESTSKWLHETLDRNIEQPFLFYYYLFFYEFLNYFKNYI